MTLKELQQLCASARVELRCVLDRGRYHVELAWHSPGRIYDRCGAVDADLETAVQTAFAALREVRTGSAAHTSARRN